MERAKTVLVLGLGRFGQSVCDRLTELGHHVVAVDMDREVVEAVSSRVELAAQLDVTDEDALEKIGAREADVAVVAIGGNSEASIMATALLNGFHIPQIVARADSPLMAKILARVGANRVVFPAREMGQIVAEQAVHPNLYRFTRLQGENLYVGDIGLHPEMVGRTLNGMKFEKAHNASVLMVEHRGAWALPDPNEPLAAEDRLMIAGAAEEVDRLIVHVREGQKQASVDEEEREDGKEADD
ncbi:MAG: TrkA family potassium uptake protein [Fretibacterium sp.]|nr:TrkA family potassium uptake protein [Fretibacterium sp.]